MAGCAANLPPLLDRDHQPKEEDNQTNYAPASSKTEPVHPVWLGDLPIRSGKELLRAYGLWMIRGMGYGPIILIFRFLNRRENLTEEVVQSALFDRLGKEGNNNQKEEWEEGYEEESGRH